jgi:hypothetical protein
MAPHNRDNLVNGPYTLERGMLTFQTKGSLLGADAARAMKADRSLTVCIYTAEGLKEITGKVLNAELVKATPPTAWEVTMKVVLERGP